MRERASERATVKMWEISCENMRDLMWKRACEKKVCLQSCQCHWCQERPYHNDSTASRLLSEVKHCRAWLVLRWGTTLESQVLFFCHFLFSCTHNQMPYTFFYLPLRYFYYKYLCLFGHSLILSFYPSNPITLQQHYTSHFHHCALLLLALAL